MDFWIPAAASRRASSLISARERMAPREARSWAVARPMPDAAPVMAMTFPLNDDSILIYLRT